jgi:hypothetical protein
VTFPFFAAFMTIGGRTEFFHSSISIFQVFNFKQQSMDYNKIPKITIESAKDFITTLPQSVPQEYLEDVDTNFHFDIAGEGGGQFSVIVKAKEENFIKLLRGELNPMMAVFSGKLKVSNPGEIMKYAKIFGFM